VVSKSPLTLLQDDEEMARELGETTGEFFRVRVIRSTVHFNTSTVSRIPNHGSTYTPHYHKRGVATLHI